jgi:hypothetical protein
MPAVSGKQLSTKFLAMICLSIQSMLAVPSCGTGDFKLLFDVLIDAVMTDLTKNHTIDFFKMYKRPRDALVQHMISKEAISNVYNAGFVVWTLLTWQTFSRLRKCITNL